MIEIPQFASAGTKVAPSSGLTTSGFLPLQKLPAENLNYELNALSQTNAELASVLRSVGLTPVSGELDQVTQAIPVKIPTISGLRSIPIIEGLNLAIYAQGYWEEDDGAGGPPLIPVWGAAPGTYVDNGGSIFVPAGGDGSKAYTRTFSGKINAKWFGARPGAAGASITADAVQAALDMDQGVHIPAGDYRFNKTVILTNFGAVITGDGIEATEIRGTDSTIVLFNSRNSHNSIRDMRLYNAHTGIQLAQRGTPGTGVGSGYSDMFMAYSLYIDHCTYGIRSYYSNTARFRDVFIISCTEDGFNFTPVGDPANGNGNTNGMHFSGCRAYDCKNGWNFAENPDGGNNPNDNYIEGSAESNAEYGFIIKGKRNDCHLYAENSGIANFDLAEGNAYFLRNPNNETPALDESLMNFYGAKINYTRIGRAQNSPEIATVAFTGSASINAAVVYGQGKHAVVRVDNTTATTKGLTMELFANMPIGFELDLVPTKNTNGFLMHVPATGGPWTTEGWSDGDTLMAFAQWVAVRFVKTSATNILRIR